MAGVAGRQPLTPVKLIASAHNALPSYSAPSNLAKPQKAVATIVAAQCMYAWLEKKTAFN